MKKQHRRQTQPLAIARSDRYYLFLRRIALGLESPASASGSTRFAEVLFFDSSFAVLMELLANQLFCDRPVAFAASQPVTSLRDSSQPANCVASFEGLLRNVRVSRWGMAPSSSGGGSGKDCRSSPP